MRLFVANPPPDQPALLLSTVESLGHVLVTEGIRVGAAGTFIAASGAAVEQAKTLITATIEEWLVGGSTLDDVRRDWVATT